MCHGFARVAEDRVYMAGRLSEVAGLTVYPSKANFLFVELPEGVPAAARPFGLARRRPVGLRLRERRSREDAARARRRRKG